MISVIIVRYLISQLSFLSKLTERVVKLRLVHYCSLPTVCSILSNVPISSNMPLKPPVITALCTWWLTVKVELLTVLTRLRSQPADNIWSSPSHWAQYSYTNTNIHELIVITESKFVCNFFAALWMRQRTDTY